MDLAWLVKRFPEKTSRQADAALREKIRTMAGLIDITVKSVRKISTELRPSILDDLGLEAAIEWQLNEFEARTGILGNFHPTLGEIDLSNDQATTAFRIFQEALTNVARHAAASVIEVDLRAGDDLVLEIKDDGRGITPGELANTKSLGLLGMRERARLLNGQVGIIGLPGQGTTVSLRLPLRPAERPQPVAAAPTSGSNRVT
jgi:signal transduction histidine kinase